MGAIVPWNFPLNIAMWKVAPALAAGCTVVLKPASETPLTAIALGQIMLDAGLPAGALNVVAGGGRSAGMRLVRHPDVDKISFTGSTEVGKTIMREAAGTVKRLTLELGGQEPQYRLCRRRPGSRRAGSPVGHFLWQGRGLCGGQPPAGRNARQRPDSGATGGTAPEARPGKCLDKATRMGALVSKKQQENVLGYIEKGKSEGASIVAGGKAATVNGKGYFVEATVFDGDQPERCSHWPGGNLGPVLAVLPFDSFEEAVHLANQSMYGLSAGI